MASPDGRSPFVKRQLDDLRPLPTADDPRPTFFWSAVAPRNVDLTQTFPYPRLMWHVEHGEEIVVQDLAEHQAKQAEGCWTETQPTAEPVDPLAEIQAELDALSPDDRQVVIEAQRQQRLQALQAKMAGLSERSLETLLNDAKDQATGTAKRGPGRPRKTA